MDSGIQMFTTDSVSTISSGKIVAQTSTFEQTSMTDDRSKLSLADPNDRRQERLGEAASSEQGRARAQGQG